MNDLLIKTYFLSCSDFNEFVIFEKINEKNINLLMEFNPYLSHLIAECENKKIYELRQIYTLNTLKNVSYYLELKKDKINEDFNKLPKSFMHKDYGL